MSVALGRVRDARAARDHHRRERQRSLADGVARQLEQPSIRRELRKLPARVAGLAVLPRLPGEKRLSLRDRIRSRFTGLYAGGAIGSKMDGLRSRLTAAASSSTNDPSGLFEPFVTNGVSQLFSGAH
jgi:hypothetical protein